MSTLAEPGTRLGAVTAPDGYVAAGVHAGIRRSALDVAVVVSTVPAVGAGMFTANRFRAAPVLASATHLIQAEPRAIVINSGVANAATGRQGMLNAGDTARCAGGLLGLASEQILVLSAGVIGALLPMEKLAAGVTRAAASPSPTGGDAAAPAIMTTDSRPKQTVVSRSRFTVGGWRRGRE